MRVLRERSLPDDAVPRILEVLVAHHLDPWCYRGVEWFVLDADAPHVAQESATCAFSPVVRSSYADLGSGVAKVVGVSDDHDAVQAATDAVRAQFGDSVSATPSQPYYLDVTHPDANKGSAVAFLAATLGIAEEEIATIGDMPNDVLMFARSGLSIAMGNADTQVQRSARHVTSSNDDEGFANAMERFILEA